MILLLLVGVLGLGATYMMLRAFNVSAELSTSRQLKNALILEEAKAALLMYVSAQVASEAYPGKLPCPEDTTKIGTANEGRTQTYCSLPAVGRLPWKTLGYASAPLDLDGEQLWYAVSPGFNRASVGTTLTINSNTTAGLTVDDSPARAVALIFSPGRPLEGQSRSTVTSASLPVASNYLDLENATLDIKFATHAPASGSVSTVFNDQVAIVSHQDLFAVVEPAVAKRLSDTLVTGTKPLTSVYATTSWGASAAAPVFPYAAPFGNPDTATYQGTNGTTQGLLPVTFSTNSASQYCSTATDGVRCDPTFVQWISFQSITGVSGGMTLYPTPAPTCTVTASLLSCTIHTSTTGTLCSSSGIIISLVATASNVAMALRQLDSSAPYLYGSNMCSSEDSASAIINSDGSAQITFTGRVSDSGTLSASNTCPDAPSPYTCRIRTFSIPIRIFADHPIVNSSDSESGWFIKNEWHKLMYYAVAPGFAASGARSCTAPNCLTITNLGTTPTDNKRAILILAGRPIGVQTRSSAALSNYLESENVSPIDSTFVTQKPSREFNDRVIVVDSN